MGKDGKLGGARAEVRGRATEPPASARACAAKSRSLQWRAKSTSAQSAPARSAAFSASVPETMRDAKGFRRALLQIRASDRLTDRASKSVAFPAIDERPQAGSCSGVCANQIVKTIQDRIGRADPDNERICSATRQADLPHDRRAQMGIALASCDRSETAAHRSAGLAGRRPGLGPAPARSSIISAPGRLPRYMAKILLTLSLQPALAVPGPRPDDEPAFWSGINHE